jgi:thymidylate synthase (FAD)
MKAEYYSHMGSDNMVVDMARASFSKKAESYTAEQNSRLIKYLARGMSEAEQKAILEEAAASSDLSVVKDCFQRMNAQSHWAPFAHPQITLHIECPIFVARQEFKHIVGFVRSEASRRYVNSVPEFYVPEEWRSRPEGSIKQGSGDVHPYNDNLREDYAEIIRELTTSYNNMISAGVAPEQARMILPQSMYTSYYVTGSLAAWARAYKLRIDSHSQQEIQELAKQWDAIIQPLFPESWAALTE